MSTRANVASVVASIGVLAVGWQLGNSGSATGSVQARPASTTATTGASQTPKAGASQTAKSGASATAPAARTTTTAPAQPAQPAPGGRQGRGGTPVNVTLKVPSGASGTFTGQSSQNRWGTVQVTVTLDAGRITALSENIDDYGDGHSSRINSQAVAVLKQSILAASGGGNVATVSGATYTTTSYLTSLQSALDQAG